MALVDEKAHKVQSEEKPLSAEESRALSREVPKWSLHDGSLETELRFHGFGEAMEYVNQVATIAQREDHHPDIQISYDTVHLTLSTHKIGGLSRNDFIVAAKIDRLM
jgi:4a-hydroxytetrahydrobiopterin dehydratase